MAPKEPDAADAATSGTTAHAKDRRQGGAKAKDRPSARRKLKPGQAKPAKAGAAGVPRSLDAPAEPVSATPPADAKTAQSRPKDPAEHRDGNKETPATDAKAPEQSADDAQPTTVMVPAPVAPADVEPEPTPAEARRARRMARKQARAQSKLGEDFTPPPTAPAARPRSRHWAVVAGFLFMVLAPTSLVGWYLYERAADQYASTLGFSVRKEEGATAFESIGGIFDLGSGSSSDTDVLYEFIQSQELVARVDQLLDLRRIYAKPSGDPIFTVQPDATIEELVDYWQRVVTIFYDAGSGLMEVRVLAFDPDDAQRVSQAILDESSAMINAISTIAREDSTRYARDDLERTVADLKVARTALTEFRADNQIVDPESEIQINIGLLQTLQSQLAESLVELDLLRQTAREGDPRIRQTEQRILVIENRIAEEREKFGLGTTPEGRSAYASLVGEYESLVVDREFAESSYLAAQTNYNAALAEATRQSRYLAPHIRPTLAKSAEYPRRAILLLVVFLCLTMAWSVATMVYYSIKDRR